MKQDQLSLGTYVVICRWSGRYYLSEDGAIMLFKTINSENRPRMVKIEESIISTDDIVSIVPAPKFEEIERQRKGEWKCQHESWHSKGEKCACSWGRSNKTAHVVTEEQEKEINPEDAERGRLVKELLSSKRIKIRDIKDLKSKSNKELQQMLNDV